MRFELWEVTDAAMQIPAFPAVDIQGGGVQNGHVFCGQHPNLGGAIFISPLQVTEIVRAAAPALGSVERAAIATQIGALSPELREAYEDEIEKLEEQIAFLKENLSVPLAEVIDLVAEREKRRPVTPTETAA